MPHQPTTEIRLKNIIASLAPLVPLLNEISDSFGTPFVRAISNTTLSLITAVQDVKKDKDKCIQLMENINKLLYGIINLHVESKPPGSLDLATLHHIGEFTETIHKVHTFVEAQQDGNRFKQFWHQSEMKTLLKDCHAGLQQALESFKIGTGTNIFGNVAEMQKETKRMHNELLELIATLSDGTTSDRSSSIHRWADGSENSSNSISMLPAQPKIFYGRESELKEIIEALHKGSARVSILGPGGMGKTSLAKATLHHPHIVAAYQIRLFVACDSATTDIEIAALIGSHIGLRPEKNLTKPVAHYFSTHPDSLLILDNLDPAWEPLGSRNKVENFLALLTDITHLTLIITMRGAERPAKVRWTRPFLPPLKPLPKDDARKIFIDIAEDFHNVEEVNQLLSLTDNLPLAVDLMAHLVESEGCSNVLARWETEKTSVLSDGHDKRSNLDTSIAISLSSPRMTSGAKDLLSLLSILPDGLSDVELVQSKLPISDVQTSKTALLGTSLAYTDDKQRLKVLVPIREHMQSFCPAPPGLIYQLQKYFHALLNLYWKHSGTQQAVGKAQITANLTNLHQILMRALYPANSNLADTIGCTLSLNSFIRETGRGRTVLMDHLPAMLHATCDARLQVSFMIEVFTSHEYHPVSNPEQLITEAMPHIHNLNDPILEARSYHAVGCYYFFNGISTSTAMHFLDKALILGKSCTDKRLQCILLNTIAEIEWKIGHYRTSQLHAHAAQGIAQLCGDLSHEAYAQWIEAVCVRSLGDYKNCIFICHRVQKLLELCGMCESRLGHNIINVEAEVHQLKSEYAEARSLHTKIVQNTSADQNAYVYAFGLLNIADIDIMMGVSTQEVHDNLDKAKGIFSNIHYRPGITCCELSLASLHLREREILAAKDIFLTNLNTSWGENTEIVSYCLERLADVSQWPDSDSRWPFMWPILYLSYAAKMNDKLALLNALEFLAHVFLAQSDDETAHNLFMVALEEFTFMDIHRSRAKCKLHLGDISRNRGDLLKAVEIWKEAQPLFERSLQSNYVAQIEARLAAAEHEQLDIQMELVRLQELNVSITTVEKVCIGEVGDTGEHEGGERNMALVPV
ncbi:hypothetical protein C8R44DRAFT_919353 [Mycena epipterygia]|nr:hypothetical protein C8R44DRAFT_919353 [Mycena epipterygia]